MSPEDFAQTLKEVKPGKYVELPYETFDVIFPPGPTQGQKISPEARVFARKHGFTMDDKVELKVVRFIRNA